MQRVFAIALNTFRESIRDKILSAAVVLGLGLVSFSMVLAELARDQRLRVVFDVGLASVSILGVLIAVFLGSSMLYQEIERKTLYGILSRNVRRGELIVGKWLGLTAAGATVVVILAALHMAITALASGAPIGLFSGVLGVLGVLGAVSLFFAKSRALLALPLALSGYAAAFGLALSADFDATLLSGLHALVLAEVALVTALAIFFSSFSTPLTTGVLTLGVWLVGRSGDAMAEVSSRALPEAVRTMLHGLTWVAPNFNLFVPGRTILTAERAAHGLVAYLGATTAYGFLYAALLLAAGAVLFGRRDLP
jgi:Cu-processing system permease protein